MPEFRPIFKGGAMTRVAFLMRVALHRVKFVCMDTYRPRLSQCYVPSPTSTVPFCVGGGGGQTNPIVASLTKYDATTYQRQIGITAGLSAPFSVPLGPDCWRQ